LASGCNVDAHIRIIGEIFLHQAGDRPKRPFIMVKPVTIQSRPEDFDSVKQLETAGVRLRIRNM
jgi:hypothetical protein